MHDGAVQVSELSSNGKQRQRRTSWLPEAGPFIEQVEVEHGPAGMLGRFFLAADTFVRDRGLTLHFASFEEMSATQEREKSNWQSLIPAFDHRVTDIPRDQAFCISVRDPKGKIVGMTAERFYDLTGSSLGSAVSSGAFMPIEPPGPNGVRTVCELTAPNGSQITGRTCYSGAVWVHPEYRSLRLAGLLPRVTRACALTTWDIECNFGFVKTGDEKSALVKRYGLPHGEPGMKYQSYWQSYDGVIIWMNVEELLDDLGTYLNSISPQIDIVGIASGA
jgi:hypothetical protein